MPEIIDLRDPKEPEFDAGDLDHDLFLKVIDINRAELDKLALGFSDVTELVMPEAADPALKTEVRLALLNDIHAMDTWQDEEGRIISQGYLKATKNQPVREATPVYLVTDNLSGSIIATTEKQSPPDLIQLPLGED